MAARLRSARRLVYIYFRCLGQQMKAILAYEADFVVLMFSAVLVQITGFLFIWTIFQRIPNINGWTFWQVVMMYALIFVTEGVGSLFFEGTWRLSYLVYTGQFDQMLLRPVSPIVQVLAGAVGFNGLGNIVTGSALIGISIANVPVAWTPGRLLMLVDPDRQRVDHPRGDQSRLRGEHFLGPLALEHGAGVRPPARATSPSIRSRSTRSRSRPSSSSRCRSPSSASSRPPTSSASRPGAFRGC